MTQTALAPSPSDLILRKAQYDDLVLDGSGSMQGMWWDMLQAIDGYVDQLRSNQVESHLRLSIFTSNGYIDLVARECALEAFVPLRDDPPGSHFLGTPLYDAINLAGRRFAKLMPARAALTILTDGEEQGSQSTSLTQAKAVLDWVRANGWQVTFIGCDFDNSSVAKALGASDQSAIGVAGARLGDAIKALADKRARYAKTGAPMHWSDDEKQRFGGYLAKPKN